MNAPAAQFEEERAVELPAREEASGRRRLSGDPCDVMHHAREAVIGAGDHEVRQFTPFIVAQPIEHRWRAPASLFWSRQSMRIRQGRTTCSDRPAPTAGAKLDRPLLFLTGHGAGVCVLPPAADWMKPAMSRVSALCAEGLRYTMCPDS